MRRLVLALAAAVAVLGVVAGSAFGGVKQHYSHAYYSAAARCGDVREVGRNVRQHHDTLADGRHVGARRYGVLTARLDGMCRPLPKPVVVAQAAPVVEQPQATQAAPVGGGGAGGGLASIRACESGSSGGYSADTGNGFHGAYQFDQHTWDAYAPEGYKGQNPASAPPGVQDQAAAAAPRSSWPNC